MQRWGEQGYLLQGILEVGGNGGEHDRLDREEVADALRGVQGRPASWMLRSRARTMLCIASSKSGTDVGDAFGWSGSKTGGSSSAPAQGAAIIALVTSRRRPIRR
jgi:hypothetical protein